MGAIDALEVTDEFTADFVAVYVNTRPVNVKLVEKRTIHRFGDSLSFSKS